jgi:nucleotide-binding universal stress UspA family protein
MTEHRRYRRIAVPLDGSGWGERAIPHAIDIARSNDSEVVLLHAFELPVVEYMPDPTMRNEQLQQARDQVNQYLTALQGELRAQKINTTTMVLEGQGVAGLICDYVNSDKIDLVIMSTHGRTGIQRILFGSVANQVMQCAKVPVLLIRPDQE